MEKTIKNLLLTALKPIGQTLYIYGGGWNSEDNGAGEEAQIIGVSPKWQEFYIKNAEKSYCYSDFDYKINPGLIHFGLDCSGYVGWVLYNLFNDENGKAGFVDKSTKMVHNLEGMGLGSLKKASEIREYKAGDIMGGEKTGHIFICVGGCSDGSLVLLHSSPPAPMLSGTLTPKGEQSKAAALAEKYMKKAYPRHFEMFPRVSRSQAYLTDFSRFRFYTDVVSDPDGYGNMNPEEILEDLFSSP
ncbi:MAG: hypothetical protein LUD81_05365 [Clostridiales bacterium]|nr:hypothetical protein [Clostridiales bacterium]